MAREIRIVFSEKENDLKEYLETKSSATFYLKELLRNDMNSNNEFKYLLKQNEDMMISVIDKISDALKHVTIASHETLPPVVATEPVNEDFVCKLDIDDLNDLL